MEEITGSTVAFICGCVRVVYGISFHFNFSTITPKYMGCCLCVSEKSSQNNPLGKTI